MQSAVKITARAYWVAEPGRGEIRSEAIKAPAASEVLIQTRYSAISRGTEMLVFSGQVPPSEYDTMRAPFQHGTFPGPLKYGYISVGTIVDGPEDRLGSTVFCLHPHQDRYVVPSHAAIDVPADVPPRLAVLAANMETAINGLWDSGIGVGDHCVVVGAGLVGCLVAALASRIPGVEVTLVDIDPSREEIAASLGAHFAMPADAVGDADLVIHTSGNPAGLVTSLGLAGFEATILEMSWFGSRTANVPLGEAFHSKRLTLKSSQVGHVADGRRARWSHGRRLVKALDLLADPIFDRLITHESQFEDLPQTFEGLADGAERPLCHLINYDS
ncbi:MAG: zinc-binding alcohol dehydrogenase [Pseudomonadota bacterium]